MKRIILGFLASIGFLVICAGGAVFYFIIASSPIKPKLPESILLSLSLQGDLPEYAQNRSLYQELTQGSFSHYDLITTLASAQEDDRVKGLLLKLNDGSMGYAKSHEFLSALRRFRNTGKFVIAYTDTFGELENATGQYFLAAGADEIAMQPYSSISLVGLGIDLPHGKKLLDSLKITPQFYKQGIYKSALDMFTEEKKTPANEEATQALLRSLFDTLVKEIARERDLNESDVRALINQAPIHSATKAMQVGLIDHIYYQDQCEKYALKKAGKGTKKVSFFTYQAGLKKESGDECDKVALIFGEGEIITHPLIDTLPMMPTETSFDALSFGKTVDEVLKDRNVKAVVIRLNTPGGSSVASESIWRHVQRLKEKGLPVVISMGNYCASGGYWIATAADKIIANPMTVTGSIGVFGGKFAIPDLLETLGIHVDSIRFGDKSLASSPFHTFSSEEWKSHKESIDMIYYAFLAKVADGRKMDLPLVASLAKGRVWSGEDALRLGLVDALGDLNDAMDIARELAKISETSEVCLIPYPRSKNLLDRAFTLMTTDQDDDEINSQPSPVALYIHKIQSFFRKDASINVISDVRIQ